VLYELFIPVVLDEKLMIHSRLFILCSPNQSLTCDICHSSYHSLDVKFDRIVYHRIIEHVIRLLTFILLWLLFDIC